MTARVLLVEDDARLASMVADYLGEAGFRVVVAATGKAATHAIGTEGFDAGHPRPDAARRGWTRPVPQHPRQVRHSPADAHGARRSARSRRRPGARRRRLSTQAIRAARAAGAAARHPAPAQHAGFSRCAALRPARDRQGRARSARRRTAQDDDRPPVRAAARRWPSGRVACCRARRSWISPRAQSLEDFDRSIDVHISRLRAAIEDDPKRPRRILTLRGAGYVFAKEQDR